MMTTQIQVERGAGLPGKSPALPSSAGDFPQEHLHTTLSLSLLVLWRNQNNNFVTLREDIDNSEALNQS
jgi:hypothetical protein